MELQDIGYSRLQAVSYTHLDVYKRQTLENGAITQSHLEVKAKVPKLKAKDFPQYAEDAKENCPISKLLNTSITMEASLVKSFK